MSWQECQPRKCSRHIISGYIVVTDALSIWYLATGLMYIYTVRYRVEYYVTCDIEVYRKVLLQRVLVLLRWHALSRLLNAFMMDNSVWCPYNIQRQIIKWTKKALHGYATSSRRIIRPWYKNSHLLSKWLLIIELGLQSVSWFRSCCMAVPVFLVQS